MHKQKIALQTVNYCYENYCFLIAVNKSSLLSPESLTFLLLSCILLLRAKKQTKTASQKAQKVRQNESQQNANHTIQSNESKTDSQRIYHV